MTTNVDQSSTLQYFCRHDGCWAKVYSQTHPVWRWLWSAQLPPTSPLTDGTVRSGLSVSQRGEKKTLFICCRRQMDAMMLTCGCVCSCVRYAEFPSDALKCTEQEQQIGISLCLHPLEQKQHFASDSTYSQHIWIKVVVIFLKNGSSSVIGWIPEITSVFMNFFSSLKWCFLWNGLDLIKVVVPVTQTFSDNIPVDFVLLNSFFSPHFMF